MLGWSGNIDSIMAGFTYSTLTTAIGNYTEVGTSVLSSTITDQFIDNSEFRIMRDVPIDANRKEVIGNLVMLDVYGRALFLLDRAEDAPIMAPLLERELVYRLLKGPQGAALRRLVSGTRAVAGVRKAIERIRQGYKEPFSVEEIAKVAGMSASAFHRQFRASTGMTPLQYQKTLRLYEARRLLVTQAVTVASAAFSVGYQSVSQFTREYRRMFAAPPGRLR